MERLRPFAAQARAGNIWLLRAPWNGSFLAHMHNTPDGLWDVRDGTSGAFNELTAPIISAEDLAGLGQVENFKSRWR